MFKDSHLQPPTSHLPSPTIPLSEKTPAKANEPRNDKTPLPLPINQSITSLKPSSVQKRGGKGGVWVREGSNAGSAGSGATIPPIYSHPWIHGKSKYICKSKFGTDVKGREGGNVSHPHQSQRSSFLPLNIQPRTLHHWPPRFEFLEFHLSA